MVPQRQSSSEEPQRPISGYRRTCRPNLCKHLDEWPSSQSRQGMSNGTYHTATSMWRLGVHPEWLLCSPWPRAVKTLRLTFPPRTQVLRHHGVASEVQSRRAPLQEPIERCSLETQMLCAPSQDYPGQFSSETQMLCASSQDHSGQFPSETQMLCAPSQVYPGQFSSEIQFRRVLW